MWQDGMLLHMVWWDLSYSCAGDESRKVSSKLLGAHAYVQKAFLHAWYRAMHEHTVAMYVMVNDKEAMTTVSSPLL